MTSKYANVFAFRINESECSYFMGNHVVATYKREYKI